MHECKPAESDAEKNQLYAIYVIANFMLPVFLRQNPLKLHQPFNTGDVASDI